jgi:hypothetical protein
MRSNRPEIQELEIFPPLCASNACRSRADRCLQRSSLRGCEPLYDIILSSIQGTGHAGEVVGTAVVELRREPVQGVVCIGAFVLDVSLWDLPLCDWRKTGWVVSFQGLYRNKGRLNASRELGSTIEEEERL